MARPLRVEYPGAVYHITSRGNAGQPIFTSPTDFRAFLSTLAQAIDRFAWVCHGYCLMPNHYHLLLETPHGELSRGMQWLNGVYTQAFNRRHHRLGHLLQGRFKAILVEKESHLLELARYVVLNPVRAGLTKRPEAWRWSSYRATAGYEPPPPWLSTDWILYHFSNQRPQALRAYRRFVPEGVGVQVWRELRGGWILGSQAFAEDLQPLIAQKPLDPEYPRRERLANRPTLAQLFEGVQGKAARNARIHEAVRLHRYTLREVGEFLGLHPSTVSLMATRLEEGQRRGKK